MVNRQTLIIAMKKKYIFGLDFEVPELISLILQEIISAGFKSAVLLFILSQIILAKRPILRYAKRNPQMRYIKPKNTFCYAPLASVILDLKKSLLKYPKIVIPKIVG